MIDCEMCCTHPNGKVDLSDLDTCLYKMPLLMGGTSRVYVHCNDSFPLCYLCLHQESYSTCFCCYYKDIGIEDMLQRPPNPSSKNADKL